MTFQQIIERLLRSRLYRVGVVLELDEGETRTGLVNVKELIYDGSRSTVIIADPLQGKGTVTIPLSRISRVEVVSNPDAA